MKFGFVASYGMIEQVLGMAREAEAHDWDGVFTWDGISVGDMDTYDPWTLLGAMAMVTERVRLGAMVFALPRRRPWKVAREAITVDHLSHGRLVMPVAFGATPDAGISKVNTDTADRKVRAQKLDETLAFLEQAWTGEPFSFEGEHGHYRTGEMVFKPTPVQRPRIPIWNVGAWPRETSMRRAIRWDGVIAMDVNDPFAHPGPGMVREMAAWVREHREGDAPFDIVIEGVTEDGDEARERIAALADAGATWFIESRWDRERDTPERLLERIRQGPPRP